jgi:hypothetical protein
MIFDEQEDNLDLVISRMKSVSGLVFTNAGLYPFLSSWFLQLTEKLGILRKDYKWNDVVDEILDLDDHEDYSIIGLTVTRKKLINE